MVEFVLRMGFGIAVLWAMVVFLLVIHEYGHAAAMNKLGIKPDLITIGSFKMFDIKIGAVVHRFGWFPVVGFVTSEQYMRATVGKRAIVAAAGPMASLLLGALFIVLGALSDNWLMIICGKASVFLAITNLVPLPPMDAWPVLEWALSRKGIIVGEFTKRRLQAFGWGVIGLIIFLSML